MKIQKCTEADISSVGAFYDQVVEFLEKHVNYPKWVYKEYPSEQSAKESIRKGEQYMCTVQEQVVGAFVLNNDPQGKYDNVKWSVELAKGEYLVCHTLAVKPSAKGTGVGRLMVEYCIGFARSQGYKAVRLDVVPDNIPAKRLYEKCGFRYVGDVDLERDIPEIPVFSMYEFNLD